MNIRTDDKNIKVLKVKGKTVYRCGKIRFDPKNTKKKSQNEK